MTYTLDFWHYGDDVDTQGDAPVPVMSREQLEELLEYVLAHEQPHPPQIVARERPRVGPADMPDTLIKIDVTPGQRMGAILFVGPESWNDPVEGDTSTGIYVTLNTSPTPGVPTLYIDKDTRTPFPADAAIPIDQVLAALEEFRQTGDRPTCVSWQESEVY